MEEITLEKVDQVKARTGVSYAEAKKGLESCGGNVLETIILLEKNHKINHSDNKENESEKDTENINEFKEWLGDLIQKGNISRVKIKKDNKMLVDIPVNAGIAATVIAIIIPPILAFVVIAAVATKITIEITKEDGSVEVVNKYISKVADEVKGKSTIFAGHIKNKFDEVKENFANKESEKQKVYTGEETVYSYTVNFDKEESEK
ncbi:DUF4342 domain-containing protein [Clostridium vincentii]|uniref:DUF4342 domain-containing protein n=1 Tax=Clostridium vincentii TaxID=52704 RepID=A0A2T0BJ90_9CLOT|nr:DUF4342 domain-containing protein [Clostridium vincentii]PRR83913.1 hypothetical protein CLVI_05670 [Clostridium vincentii]